MGLVFLLPSTGIALEGVPVLDGVACWLWWDGCSFVRVPAIVGLQGNAREAEVVLARWVAITMTGF